MACAWEGAVAVTTGTLRSMPRTGSEAGSRTEMRWGIAIRKISLDFSLSCLTDTRE